MEDRMGVFRGFIAVEVNASSSIVKLIEEIKHLKDDIKVVEPCNIHITLKFLGDTEEDNVDIIEDIMRDISRGVSPFRVKLRNVGFFPDEKYIRVIYINMEDEGNLSMIATRLDDELSSLGYEKERRGFKPHLTVARVKRLTNRMVLLDLIRKYNGFVFDEFIVDRFMLKKSVLTQKGPVYTNLRTVCFG